MELVYINLAGRDHPLCYSWRASKQIREKFGSMDAMSDALHGKGEKGEMKIAASADAINFVLKVLLEAGRIAAKEMGIDVPERITAEPIDLIHGMDASPIQKIYETITAHSRRTVEAVAKNAGAAQEKA